MAPIQPASTSQAPTNNAAYKLLSQAHAPEKAASIFTDKIRTRPLLLNPTHANTNIQSTDKRSLRRHIRLRKKQYHTQHARPRPLSAKDKRHLNLYKLAPHEIKYDIYRGLNALWRGYMLEVLGLDAPGARARVGTVNSGSHGSLLCSADFHGMNVEVVRCVDVGRVGLRGIVVRETRSTFVVVTPEDRVVTVLKKGAVFRVVIPLDLEDGLGQDEIEMEKREPSSQTETEMASGTDPQSSRRVVFELHGSHLEVRPVERAVRKFKWKPVEFGMRRTRVQEVLRLMINDLH